MLEQIPLLYIQLIILAILLSLSGFFSSYETAITTISRIQVRQMIRDKKPNAELVKKLRDNLNNTIITILIGNNLVNIAASALATIVATQLFGSSGVGIAIGVLTFLVLVFGEITPKSYATQNAEKLASKLARIFYIFSIILSPIVWILNKISTVFIRMIGGKVGQDPVVTKEAIKAIAEIGVEEGVLAESERDIIHRVVTFNSTTAKNVMTPRVNIIGVDISDKPSDIKKVIEGSHFSRLIVFDKSRDKIVGMLVANEFLRKYTAHMDIKNVIKPVHFITEERHIDDLLREMQHHHSHMMVVIEPSGGVAGVITMEDIMEELVGDIYDETDINEHLLKHINKRTFDVDSNLSVKAVDSALKLTLPKEKLATFGSMNEFILNKLGHIPKRGEELSLKDVTIEVKKVKGHKIQLVRIWKK